MAAKQALKTTNPETKTSQNALAWMFFLGTLLLLMGIYGATRIIHITKRGVPYPATGVLPTNLLFNRGPIPYERETNCITYPQIYFEVDGKTPKQPNVDEIKRNTQIEEICYLGFDEDRQKQKQYDRNLSTFLIFTGSGLLLVSKFSKKYFQL